MISTSSGEPSSHVDPLSLAGYLPMSGGNSSPRQDGTDPRVGDTNFPSSYMPMNGSKVDNDRPDFPTRESGYEVPVQKNPSKTVTPETEHLAQCSTCQVEAEDGYLTPESGTRHQPTRKTRQNPPVAIKPPMTRHAGDPGMHEHTQQDAGLSVGYLPMSGGAPNIGKS